MQGDLRGPAARSRRVGRRLRVVRLTGTASTGAALSPLAPRYRAATVGLLTLVTLIAFEAFAVSTAMPVAAQALGGVREYGLAFSLFLTTSLLGIVAAGRWSDRRGPRQPLVTGLALFAGGLVVSGLASSFTVLLVGRAISGAGGGLQVVALYVVVAQMYPSALQPRVFGAISAAWVLPSVLGPPVAGLMATELSWRSVFLAVPPLAVAPLPVLWPRLRPAGSGAGTATSAGEPGVVGHDAAAGDAVVPQAGVIRELGAGAQVLRGLGLALGAVALQWGLQGAGDLPGVPVAVAGAALAAVSVPALLPRGTFRLRRGLPSLVVARAMFTGTYFGAETFVPLMLVTQRGLSPTLAGLALTAGAVGWSAGSYAQGRGLLPIARTGLLSVGGLAVGLSILGLVPTPYGQVPTWVVAAVWAVSGVGMGLAMSSTSVLTLRLSAPGEEGRNSAGLQIGDAIGGVLGIGTAGAIFAALHTPDGDDSGAFALIWAVLGVLGVLSSVVALRVAPDGPTKPRD